jgi:hypothetical protein
MDGVEVTEAKLSIDLRGLAVDISFEEAEAYEQTSTMKESSEHRYLHIALRNDRIVSGDMQNL